MNAARVVDVACLCAAWCRVCEGYRAAFDAVRADAAAAARPGVLLRWHWIDIEDEDALIGELDIETFPMLVIAEGPALRFAGPLTPQAATLRRVLAACLDDAASPADSGSAHRENSVSARRESSGSALRENSGSALRENSGSALRAGADPALAAFLQRLPARTPD